MPSPITSGSKTTVASSVIQNPATEQSSNPLAGKPVTSSTTGTTTKVAGTASTTLPGVSSIIQNPA
jgi:hypothetical protein